jgi:hypothetical protein
MGEGRPDTTKPVLSDGSMECRVGVVTTVTLTFTSSEEGTYYYRILEASHTAPSAGVIKVLDYKPTPPQAA